MDKVIWKKSVITPGGVIDVTAHLPDDRSIEPYVEIVSGDQMISIPRSLARSLAGSIAAGAAKIEAAMLAA